MAERPGEDQRQESSQLPATGIPQEWREFSQWYRDLSREDRMRGRREGQWPENTPPLFVDLATKTTPEELLLARIFGNHPSIEEVQARPNDYLQKMEEERKLKETPTHELLREQIREVLSSLTERESLVLTQRFGLDDGRSKTLVQVGEMINRSESTVRRVEKNALAKLRHPSRNKSIKDFLE